jgi:hypothetical protein
MVRLSSILLAGFLCLFNQEGVLGTKVPKILPLDHHKLIERNLERGLIRRHLQDSADDVSGDDRSTAARSGDHANSAGAASGAANSGQATSPDGSAREKGGGGGFLGDGLSSITGGKKNAHGAWTSGDSWNSHYVSGDSQKVQIHKPEHSSPASEDGAPAVSPVYYPYEGKGKGSKSKSKSKSESECNSSKSKKMKSCYSSKSKGKGKGKHKHSYYYEAATPLERKYTFR